MITGKSIKYVQAFLYTRIGCILVLSLLLSHASFAQEESPYEEIIISISIQGMGLTELPALVSEEKAYLPVTDFFDFLKIKNEQSKSLDTVSGFFLNKESTYFIDKTNNKIIYNGKVFDIKPEDFIHTETGLYLGINYFGEIFGLDCKFNYRALLINVVTSIELPVVREARLSTLRRNINRLRGEVVVDTTLSRHYPLFHFGMADWAIIATQQPGSPSIMQYNLGLGAVVAGGETNVMLNYTKGQPFNEKRQQYIWKLVNNNYTAVKQINVGKIINTYYIIHVWSGSRCATQ